MHGLYLYTILEVAEPDSKYHSNVQKGYGEIDFYLLVVYIKMLSVARTV